MTDRVGIPIDALLHNASKAIARAGVVSRRGEPAGRVVLRLALRVAMVHASNSRHTETLRRTLADSPASRLPAQLTSCLHAFGGGRAGGPWCRLVFGSTSPEVLRAALVRLLDQLEMPSPDDLASAYEQILAGSDRKRRGAYYTPHPIVNALLDDALTPRTRTVCDPSCGTGRFLIEAARRIVARCPRGSRASAIAARVFGVDLDPCAAEVCAFGLWTLAGDPSASIAEVAAGIAIGDSTIAPPGCPSPGSRFSWDAAFAGVFGPGGTGGFDAVVGNPPFLGQLKSETATSRERAARLTAWSNGLLRGYADEASTFLLLAMRLARRGGRVCLVQPMSLLSASHAAPIRAAVCERASMASIWISDRHSFPGVGVYTCAPLFTSGVRTRRAIARRLGPDALPAPTSAFTPREIGGLPTWSALLAEALGVPRPAFTSRGTLADLAHATADFRDQYYGLQGCIEEAPDGELLGQGRHGLLTSGLIAPGRSLWGESTCRIHKRVWTRPCVRLDGLSPAMREWARTRLVPKLLIATQTRTIECVADTAGRWLPCVPVVTMTPRSGVSVRALEAIVSSPLLTAIAFQRHAGSALNPGALKLSAKDLLNLPAPATNEWLDRHSGSIAAQSVLDAYRVPKADREVLMAWWRRRTAGDTDTDTDSDAGDELRA